MYGRELVDCTRKEANQSGQGERELELWTADTELGSQNCEAMQRVRRVRNRARRYDGRWPDRGT